MLPDVIHRLGFGAFGAGALVALPALAAAVAQLPGAAVLNRFGADRVLVVAVAAAGVTTLSFPLADGVPGALINRFAFGWSLGLVFVASAELLSRLERTQPTRTGTSALVVASGVGLAVAPPVSGVLAGLGGVWTPFWILGAMQLLCVPSLLVPVRGQLAKSLISSETAGALRATVREGHVVFAVAGLFLSGFIGNAANVLAAFDLRSAGLSEAATGWVLGIGVATYLVVSVVVSNSRVRVVGTVVLVAAVVAQTVSFTPAAASPTVATIAFTLFLAGLTRGFVSSVAFPYAEAAGNHARIPSATVFAFLFGSWSSAAVVAPLAAGAFHEVAGTSAWLATELTAVAILAAVTTYARSLSRETWK